MPVTGTGATPLPPTPNTPPPVDLSAAQLKEDYKYNKDTHQITLETKTGTRTFEITSLNGAAIGSSKEPKQPQLAAIAGIIRKLIADAEALEKDKKDQSDKIKDTLKGDSGFTITMGPSKTADSKHPGTKPPYDVALKVGSAAAAIHEFVVKEEEKDLYSRMYAAFSKSTEPLSTLDAAAKSTPPAAKAKEAPPIDLKPPGLDDNIKADRAEQFKEIFNKEFNKAKKTKNMQTRALAISRLFMCMQEIRKYDSSVNIKDLESRMKELYDAKMFDLSDPEKAAKNKLMVGAQFQKGWFTSGPHDADAIISALTKLMANALVSGEPPPDPSKKQLEEMFTKLTEDNSAKGQYNKQFIDYWRGKISLDDNSAFMHLFRTLQLKPSNEPFNKVNLSPKDSESIKIAKAISDHAKTDNNNHREKLVKGMKNELMKYVESVPSGHPQSSNVQKFKKEWEAKINDCNTKEIKDGTIAEIQGLFQKLSKEIAAKIAASAPLPIPQSVKTAAAAKSAPKGKGPLPTPPPTAKAAAAKVASATASATSVTPPPTPPWPQKAKASAAGNTAPAATTPTFAVPPPFPQPGDPQPPPLSEDLTATSPPPTPAPSPAAQTPLQSPPTVAGPAAAQQAKKKSALPPLPSLPSAQAAAVPQTPTPAASSSSSLPLPGLPSVNTMRLQTNQLWKELSLYADQFAEGTSERKKLLDDTEILEEWIDYLDHPASPIQDSNLNDLRDTWIHMRKTYPNAFASSPASPGPTVGSPAPAAPAFPATPSTPAPQAQAAQKKFMQQFGAPQLGAQEAAAKMKAVRDEDEDLSSIASEEVPEAPPAPDDSSLTAPPSSSPTHTPAPSTPPPTPPVGHTDLMSAIKKGGQEGFKLKSAKEKAANQTPPLTPQQQAIKDIADAKMRKEAEKKVHAQKDEDDWPEEELREP